MCGRWTQHSLIHILPPLNSLTFHVKNQFGSEAHHAIRHAAFDRSEGVRSSEVPAHRRTAMSSPTVERTEVLGSIQQCFDAEASMW